MAKKLLLAFFFVAFGLAQLRAKTPPLNTARLVKILGQKSPDSLQRNLYQFFKGYFTSVDSAQLQTGKRECYALLGQYNVDNKEAYKYFIESICQGRLHNPDAAANAIVKAIKLVDKSNGHFLLFICFSHLGVIQTEKGNGTAAIYSYWQAKKEVEMLGSDRPHWESSLDINISDLYYKNDVYSQSLFYLDKAEDIINNNDFKERQHFLTIIYYNKAENFFRMGSLDSLKACAAKLNAPGNVSTRLYNYRQRTAYYIELLKHNYARAVLMIKTMQADTQYKFSPLENQHLADAYFASGQTDSAKKAIGNLLKEPLEANNPGIKFHLYEKLALLAEKAGDNNTATMNYKLALKEAEKHIDKLTQVGKVSSEMKIDDIESSFKQQQERQRLVYTFILIVAALLILMIFMFYRSVRQKRHYENLLHKAERHELAFINSHEVRKHLCNVLGMINVINMSECPSDTFFEAQEYLYHSADQLDDAIKNIAEKLND